MKKLDEINQKPQIFILDASAGTGKTYNLALKYISYLFNVSKDISTDSPFKNILAITFTNKAAKEMKERIIEILKRTALLEFKDEKEKENLFLKIGVPIYNEREIKEKSLELLEFLLKDYNYFQVKTIDSFVNTLVSNCAMLLNILPNFEIEKEYYEYFDYCVNALIDKSSGDEKIKKIFKNFINNYLVVENRKSWFPKLYLLNISRLFYEYTRIYGKEFKDVNIEKFHREINQLKHKIVKNLELLLSKISQGVNQNFLNSLRKFLQKIKEQKNFVISDFENKSILKYEIPVNKYYTVPKDVNNLWKRIRRQISKLAEFEAFNTYDSYIEIFNYIEKDFKKLAKRKNVVFLEELNHILKRLISKEILPEIFLRLSVKIYHYLIDEFQDTSRLQWENLFPLIHESISSKGTLFIVGDKKQSIYRFRGGEASLFDDVTDFYFKEYNYKKEFLQMNWRSEKEIVEFNNKIFSKENLNRFFNLCEDLKQIYGLKEDVEKIYSVSQQEYDINKSDGYVYGELIEISEKEDLEERIKPKLLNIVDKLKDNKKDLSKVAILLRTSDEVQMVTEWLIERNIPVESEKTLDIRENKLIKEIISLLKFLICPIDNLSFCAFISGDVFTKATGIHKEEIQQFIFLTNQVSSNEPIYKSFADKYPPIWNRYFLKLFEFKDFLSTYDLIIKIYSLFNVLENFYEYYGFFMLLLELANTQEEEDCSIENFIEYFESKNAEVQNFYVKIKKGSSLKVMTIHKAKGLEFDVVILPLIRMEIELGKQKFTNSRFLIKEDGEFLNIVKVKKNLGEIENKIKEVYNEEFKKLFIDELNIIYVALTRAKEQLYFFVPKKEKAKNYAVYLFPWENNIICCGKEIFKQDNKVIDKEIVSISPVKYEDWGEKIVDEEAKSTIQQIINKEEILKGNIIHKVLSYISNLYEKDAVSEIKNAIEKTKPSFPYVNNWHYFEDIVVDFVLSPEIKKYFFISDIEEIYCEKEMISSDGSIYRIDRLVVKNKEVWVVDYKVSFDVDKKIMDEYIEQVNGYKEIVSKIYNNKVIKGFLLSIDKHNVINV